MKLRIIAGEDDNSILLQEVDLSEEMRSELIACLKSEKVVELRIPSAVPKHWQPTLWRPE